jgi:hypothetical protein
VIEDGFAEHFQKCLSNLFRVRNAAPEDDLYSTAQINSNHALRGIN